MLAWLDLAKLLLAVMQMLNQLFDYLHDRKLIEQGVDEQIAREAASLLLKTKWGKEVSVRVKTKTGDALDQLIDSLPDSRV